MIEPECYYISYEYYNKFRKHFPVGAPEAKIKYLFDYRSYLEMNMDYHFKYKTPIKYFEPKDKCKY